MNREDLLYVLVSQCIGVGAGETWSILGSARRSSGFDMSCRSSNSYWSKLGTRTGDVEQELAEDEEDVWLGIGGEREGWA